MAQATSPAIRLTLPLTGLFYGLHFVLALTSAYLFNKSRRTEKAHAKLINSARNALFGLVTVQWILFVTQVGLGESDHDGENSTTSPLATASFVLFLAELGLSNMIMIYRLWIIGSRRTRFVIVPILSTAFFVAIICVILYAYHVARNHSLIREYSSPPYGNWLSAGLACSTAINVYCTGHVAYMIIHTRMQVQDALHPNSSVINKENISDVVLDSIVFATLMSLAVLITYVCRSSGFFLLMNIAGPIIGIAFCSVAIVTRIGVLLLPRPRASNQSLMRFATSLSSVDV